ncbi:ADP-ribosyltransferase [Bacillus toyonensis]|uniref:ADP-ribosyltransferase n=1 Tax=Bacillus toyonensis TaxID=155322 RepID=UPI000BFCF26B|nr:ADP-ribosyltransferase [Bacillus toyonensis]PHG62858.1 hypothetical protein COI59_19695 [Bacillus toyonensis]
MNNWKKLVFVCMLSIIGSIYAVPSSILPIASAANVTIKKAPAKKAVHYFDTDHTAAVGWAKENYGDWFDQLSVEQQNATTGYLNQDYKAVNSYLWKKASNPNGDIDNELEKKIKSLDSALKTSPVQESVTVYRRMGATEYGMELTDASYNFDNPENIQKFREKWMYTIKENPGFLSTTLVSDGADSLSPRKLILRLYVPDGTEGAYVNFTGSEFGGEYEFLINKGYSYIIDDITDEIGDDGKTRLIIDATLLPK